LGSRKPDDAELDTARLPSPPAGTSRVDTLPDDFVALLKHRPYVTGDLIGGRYRLLQTLGDGAMGQVFVGENLAIGSRVAVKLLKPELLADTAFRKRFQQEAMATAAVQHRNVARFIDLVVGDPTFLVVEYVQGPTLAAVLRSGGALEWKRAVKIVERICWALDAAHKRGIVHRDVKPANIILAPDDESGEEPKLIDFGLAKIPTVVGAENLTRTGQIIGTPHYMSPEQIANREVDARSDVYAVGCLLHHMLAGAPPFAGGDDVQILYRQLNDAPPPLPETLPAPLRAAVSRALEKSPERRFASMRELHQALAALTEPAASVAAPPARRSPIAWLTIAAMLVAGGGAYLAARGASKGGNALIVTSHPSEARVLVDGKPIAETTPTAIRGLSPGPHKVRVEHDGRDPAEQQIELGAAERRHIDLAMLPKSRGLSVKTIPEGASLFVDGAQIPGETPLAISLAADDFHELRVEKLGYEPTVRALKPEDRDDELTLTMDTEREPRGRLIVDSSDAGEVWIDGKSTGFEAPTIPMRIAAGAHDVELRDPATGRKASARAQVRSGETVRVGLHLGGP
jgi:serine/threonine-protein kinase